MPGIGGAGMTFAIVVTSSGAASAAAMNPATTLASAGNTRSPAHDRRQRAQPILEPRRDAKVAASAADRPEQIRVQRGVGSHDFAIRRHDVRGEDVVDGQAVPAGEVPDAAPERDPADPDRTGVPELDRQPVRADRCAHVRGGQAQSPPRPCARGVDLDRSEVVEVEDDAAIVRAVAGAAVPAAPHGERQARGAGDLDDLRDVGGVGDPRDRGRAKVEAPIVSWRAAS